MKNLIERDKKRRILFKKYESKRLELKALSQNTALPDSFLFQIRLKLAKLPRNSSKTRINNRCTVTGRSKAVYKKFKISRIMIRELAAKGHITGVKKSSW